MTSHILRRISKFGPIMGNLVASAIGCFIFTPGFRLVAMDEKGSDADSSKRADGRSPGLSMGIDAAIFLGRIDICTLQGGCLLVQWRHGEPIRIERCAVGADMRSDSRPARICGTEGQGQP